MPNNQNSFNYFDNSLTEINPQEDNFVQNQLQHFREEEVLEGRLRDGMKERIYHLSLLLDKKDAEIEDLNMWINKNGVTRLRKITQNADIREAGVLDRVNKLGKIMSHDKENFKITKFVDDAEKKLTEIKEVFGELMQVIANVFLHQRPVKPLLGIMNALIVRKLSFFKEILEHLKF